MAENQQNQQLKSWHAGVSILVLVFASYWRILDNYWFLDDTTAPFSGYLLSLDITKLFTYRFDVIYMTPIWRVFVTLSYLPNYLLSGLEPWSYYLVSIMLHAGNGWLVFLISRKLLHSAGAALLIAFLFTVSLNKADAVMMIAHRTTLLGAFFALASFYYYVCLIVDGFSKVRLTGCLLAFFAALGSYETALLMPGIFIVFGLIWRGNTFFWTKEFFIGLALATFSAVLIVFLGLGSANGVVSEPYLIARLLHMARNILAVLPSFIVPPFLLQSPNILYYSEGTGFSWIEIFGLAILLFLFAAGLITKKRTVFIGILFFLILALPTSKVPWLFYPDINTGTLHRLRWSVGKFSYLSSFGVYFACGVLFWRVFLWFEGKLRHIIALRVCTVVLLAAYFCFNLYWLYKREIIWENATNNYRKQIESLRALNLTLDPNMVVYHFGFDSYGRHAEALFRVIFKSPNLLVKYGPEDYKETTGKTENAIFIIANENGTIEAYRDAYGNQRYP